MSSKSKRGAKKGRKQPHGGHKPAGASVPAAADPAETSTSSSKKDGEEEFVYVPRGKSKMTYIFILGLMVFTLIIFVVPGQFQALFDPRAEPGSEVYMTWDHPRLGRQELTQVEFNGQHRELDPIFSFLARNDDTLRSVESIAAFLVAETLAADAGVEVTDADLATAILQGDPPLAGFGSVEAYRQAMQSWRLTPADFEAALRRVLRVQRYRALLGVATGVPDPDELETFWREDHEQHSFDALSVAVADFDEAARAELPSAEELQTWYEALPPRSGAFAAEWKGERVAAAVVGFRIDGENDAAGLLERYPGPQGPTPEGAADPAREYYDRTSTARFRRPEPDEEGEDARARLYFTFDEVAEACAAEAAIHRAMGEWLDDLRTRMEAGEELDLEQEVAGLGLSYEAAAEARDLAEWRETEEAWGGPYMGSALLRADPNGLVPDVVVDETGIALALVTEKLPAGPTPYAEIADKVADEWSVERAGELALEQLQSVYDPLAGEEPLEEGARPEADAAAFSAAAAIASLPALHRDWFDPARPDPTGYEPTPLEAYTRTATRQLRLEENQLSEPAVDDTGDHAWLLRCAGRREPPELDMRPADLVGLQQRALFTAWFGAAELTSFETYQSRYGLTLERGTATDEEEGGGEGEGEGEGEEAPEETGT